MKHHGTIRGLLLLNGLLLAVLAAVTFSSAAPANSQPRARGDYIMVGGPAPGTRAAAVYIVDAINQEMVVVTYDQNAQDLTGVAYRNLALDAASFLRGRPQQPR